MPITAPTHLQKPLLPKKAKEAAPAATADAAPTATLPVQPKTIAVLRHRPLARKIAKDKGINLNDVKGSADGGRIIKKDIEGFTPSAKPAETAKPQEGRTGCCPC
jgi:pyruvate dehydrogenase E2 component (dihydrolipoamide acetyltransferase)